MSQKIGEMIKRLRDMGIVDNTNDPRYSDKVDQMRKDGAYVYQVIDGHYNLGGDVVRMVSYCFVSEYDVDEEDVFFENFADGYAFANVVNPTWDIEEMGSIAFVRSDGVMKRVG